MTLATFALEQDVAGLKSQVALLAARVMELESKAGSRSNAPEIRLNKLEWKVRRLERGREEERAKEVRDGEDGV